MNVAGRGKPLLLITGLGGNADMWTPFVERLRSRRVIRFDAPGTGKSSTPLCPVPVSALADLAVAVLDSVDATQADVVGYSYGGAVAQQMAHDHPERIGRLVLAATTCGVGACFGSLPALAALSTPIRYYSPTYFERTAAASFGGASARDPIMRQQMIAARLQHPPSPYGYAMQLLGGATWSSWPLLPRIPHETLIISGDDDPLIPVINAEMLARWIPHATLDIVKGAGHLFLWDDAATVANRIDIFLNGRHRRARTSAARPS